MYDTRLEAIAILVSHRPLLGARSGGVQTVLDRCCSMSMCPSPDW